MEIIPEQPEDDDEAKSQASVRSREEDCDDAMSTSQAADEEEDRSYQPSDGVGAVLDSPLSKFCLFVHK